MSSVKLTTTAGNGGTVELKGPANTTSNAAVQLTLPVDDGSADQYLKTDGSGALSWATVAGGIGNVVEDTTPQLGGDLDTNSFEISLDDDHSVKFGDGTDLKIYHNGTDNYFDQVTGYLRIRDVANSREIAKFHSTNSQEFYFNGSKKLDISNTGISVTGSVTPSGGIYLGGSGGSNYLADYETGTWTAGIANDTGTAFSAASILATYTKIGRSVQIFLYWTSMANIPNNGSSWQITGLPFTTSGSHHGWGQIGYAGTHDCAHWNPLATTSGTNIYFHRTDGSGSSAANSDFTGCIHLILGLQYETAS